jgi:D-threo-aldose 1-dehydrogenase
MHVGHTTQNWNESTETVNFPSGVCWTVKLTSFEAALNAGFISGSPKYNYGKDNFMIPSPMIEKREQLQAVAARYGVDLRTAALQFSAAPDFAVALIVGARSDQQITEDYNSLQAKIPSEFRAELKQGLIEAGAALPVPPA